jgi:hypothetical protein
VNRICLITVNIHDGLGKVSRGFLR